jgi:hypothetical protein
MRSCLQRGIPRTRRRLRTLVLGYAIYQNKHSTQYNAQNLAKIFLQSSVKLRTMFSIVAEQLDALDENSIIFTASPFKQQLYITLLRLHNVKAKGVLATMAQDEKETLIRRF